MTEKWPGVLIRVVRFTEAGDRTEVLLKAPAETWEEVVDRASKVFGPVPPLPPPKR